MASFFAMMRNATTAILATQQQNLNRASKARCPQTQQALYGICHKCQSFIEIEIPGLEAFKCSGTYRWVKRKVNTDLSNRIGGEA